MLTKLSPPAEHFGPGRPATRAYRGILTEHLPERDDRVLLRPTGLGAAPRKGRDQMLRRLGSRWEPPTLASALGSSVSLTCAALHLRKHGGDQVAKTQMHSWGSRGRGFKSRRPDTGLPTELPVLYRQNSAGGLFFRISALRQLVLQAPVIAAALGLHYTTTERQHANAGATWSRYPSGDHTRTLTPLPAAGRQPAGPG